MRSLSVLTPLLLVLLLAAVLLPTAGSESLGDRSGVNDQGLFGGLHLLASNQTSGSAQAPLIDLPDVAEVYTASWCEPCVVSEETFQQVVANHSEEVVELQFHRAIGETQDPFGTQAGDERWEARYGAQSEALVGLKRAPPTIIINGEWMHPGIVPNGEDLVEDYTSSLTEPARFEDATGTSSLEWQSSDGESGTVTWSVTLPSADVEGVEFTSLLIAVEESAYFEEGSNGLGDYPHVVRDVVDLGSGSGGELAYTLPDEWDGEDISLVLIHQWSAPPPTVVIEDKGFLPAAGLALVVTAIGLALLERRSRV